MNDALMVTAGILLGILTAFVVHRYNLNPLTKRKQPATILEPEEAVSDDEILERVAGVEKAQRMLMGRLNKLAPPRQGTGNGGQLDDVLETPLPPTRARAQVLQNWRRRNQR